MAKYFLWLKSESKVLSREELTSMDCFLRHLHMHCHFIIFSLTIVFEFLGKKTKAQWRKMDFPKHIEFKYEFLALEAWIKTTILQVVLFT